jgi:hypothetical protein
MRLSPSAKRFVRWLFQEEASGAGARKDSSTAAGQAAGVGDRVALELQDYPRILSPCGRGQGEGWSSERFLREWIQQRPSTPEVNVRSTFPI